MNFSFFIFHSSLPRVKPSRREGFTLVEVITVIMIIAILMGATTSAVSGARKTAMRTHTRDTVRQLAAAWTAYVTDQGRFPDADDFEKVSGNRSAYPASPKNIGGLLNTQYQMKKVNGKFEYDYTKPRKDDSITYFATTREECEPENDSRKLDSWPALDKTGKIDGRRGVCDKWKHVIYFCLDSDYNGKVVNPIAGGEVTASALAYSSAEFDPGETNERKRKKFIVAW